MRDCELKSTGYLVDELLTLDLKIAAGNEDAQERRHELANVIIERSGRLALDDLNKYRQFQHVTEELKNVLTDCWNFQETIMALPAPDECTVEQAYEGIRAGKGAQETNARRNRLVRQLDGLVGETSRTQLSKTYDKE